MTIHPERAIIARLFDILDRSVEAYDCLMQPYRLSGAVTPDTPGGQGTALLRDGTPVARGPHAAKVYAEARALCEGREEIVAALDGADARRTDEASTDAPLTASAKRIADECDRVKAMLIEKNNAYGNSALDPVRVFSRADSVEQIKVRIDDKLSRLARGTVYGDEDTVLDLLGYLVLLRIAVAAPKAEQTPEKGIDPVLEEEPERPFRQRPLNQQIDLALEAADAGKRGLVHGLTFNDWHAASGMSGSSPGHVLAWFRGEPAELHGHDCSGCGAARRLHHFECHRAASADLDRIAKSYGIARALVPSRLPSGGVTAESDRELRARIAAVAYRRVDPSVFANAAPAPVEFEPEASDEHGGAQ